ncbi:ABC transporter ATP-binding protein [Corynebacterium sp. CCM 9204]|uniref:iron ABC transporter ATP-binding protein n=1 Tax=Corynebacterium sp. CCM 9204 TaxID=3057616 RepID=UPI003524D454
MIRIAGVTKKYDSNTVVNDVSVDIPTGGVTSVIGPNGAGKSTLLGIISRLIRADGGTVSVDGHDVRSTPSRKLAQILSVLRQENRVAVRLTVRDLVAFGRFPHSAGQMTQRDEEAIQRALEYLELEEFSERNLDELSGGQRQRAFVAMVLAQETDYILLDEPLNNLDIKHSLAMMKLLRRTAEELGRTVVVVIHDINFAAAYSDWIIAMKNGSLVHSCTPEELMTTENLASLYDVDLTVTEVCGRPVAMYF